MIALSVAKYVPAVNPNVVFLKATITGNYTQVTGDAINLTPSSWTDPNALGVVGPDSLPTITPAPFSQSLGGYYAEITKGTTLANYLIRFFSSQGAELATGAYPAAILNGELTIEVPF